MDGAPLTDTEVKQLLKTVTVEGTRAPVSYTHLRAHETVLDLVCRLLLEKKTPKLKADVLDYTYVTLNIQS